jgi:hypothetical protein
MAVPVSGAKSILPGLVVDFGLSRHRRQRGSPMLRDRIKRLDGWSYEETEHSAAGGLVLRQ